MTASGTIEAVHGQLFIGGEWRPSVSGGEFETRDPASGELLGTIAEASNEDVDLAVQAAGRAFVSEEWAGLTPSARAAFLFRIADLLEQNADELALLETRDQGQPLWVARNVSVTSAVETFRYYAGWATKLEGATLPPATVPRVFQYTRREPVGVCGLITPWNFPLAIATWKVAPALACGNTVILKPAEQTPLTAIRLGELIEEAGLPAGVFNLLDRRTGDGSGADRAPGRPQDLVHRIGRGRAQDHPRGVGELQACFAGARRQDRQRGASGRRSGERGRRLPAGRSFQHGSGLRRVHATVRRPIPRR